MCCQKSSAATKHGIGGTPPILCKEQGGRLLLLACVWGRLSSNELSRPLYHVGVRSNKEGPFPLFRGWEVGSTIGLLPRIWPQQEGEGSSWGHPPKRSLFLGRRLFSKNSLSPRLDLENFWKKCSPLNKGSYPP